MAEITLKPVQSSNVQAVGYDPQARRLAVQFKGSGGIYHYDGVEQSDHDKLIGAESIGSHFSQHIRGKFPHRQVKPSG